MGISECVSDIYESRGSRVVCDVGCNLSLLGVSVKDYTDFLIMLLLLVLALLLPIVCTIGVLQ